MAPKDALRWAFVLGAVLIGLGVGEAAYAALAPVPSIPEWPVWWRVFAIVLPLYLATGEQPGSLRVGWIGFAAYGAASWIVADWRTSIQAALLLAFLQMTAGAFFVHGGRAGVEDWKRIGLLVGLGAALLRSVTAYWFAQTLSKYQPHG